MERDGHDNNMSREKTTGAKQEITLSSFSHESFLRLSDGRVMMVIQNLLQKGEA